MKKKTIKVVLEDIKDPDMWNEVIDHFGMSEEEDEKWFEYGEYASLEFELDEKMNITKGRIIPR